MLIDYLLPPPGFTLPELVTGPVWLLTNLLLVMAAWRWARLLFPDDPVLEIVGHATVLCWGGVVLVATTLGLFSLLSGPTLLLATAAGAGAALTLARRGHRPAPPPFRTSSAETAWLILWGGLLAYCMAHVFTKGLLRLPTDWDSLAYHIPMVDHWLQARSLYSPDCGRWTNPGNNELLGLWAVGPFSGDFLITLNNLPGTILLASAAVSVGSQIGLPRSWAHLGGLIVVSQGVTLTQLINAENDVAVAAAFLAALAYAFRFAAAPRSGALLLGATSLGLVAGVKYYALGYAALGLFLWGALTWSSQGWARAHRVLWVCLAGTITFGGYWYLRNFVVTGSPLYPMEFFRSSDTLTELFPQTRYTSFFGNQRAELLPLYLKAIWKVMGPAQLLGFVCVPVALILLIGRSMWQCWRAGITLRTAVRLALAGALLGTGILLGITPYAVEDVPGTLNQMHMYYCPVRYGLCFLSTATLAAILLLHDVCTHFQARCAARAHLRRTLTTGPLVLLGGVFVYQLFRTEWRSIVDWQQCLLYASNTVLFALILVLLAKLRPGLGRLVLRLALVAAVPAWAWTCHALAERWHERYAGHYDRTFGTKAFTWLGGQQAHAGKVCALLDRYYPVFGSRRQYRVCQPHHVPSPDWLKAMFRRERVATVLAVPRLHSRRFGGFDECLSESPESFRKLMVGHEFSLFQVSGARLGASGGPDGLARFAERITLAQERSDHESASLAALSERPLLAQAGAAAPGSHTPGRVQSHTGAVGPREGSARPAR
jgi:hypothetical protein